MDSWLSQKLLLKEVIPLVRETTRAIVIGKQLLNEPRCFSPANGEFFRFILSCRQGFSGAGTGAGTGGSSGRHALKAGRCVVSPCRFE